MRYRGEGLIWNGAARRELILSSEEMLKGKVKRAVELTKRAEIATECSFILGGPYER